LIHVTTEDFPFDYAVDDAYPYSNLTAAGKIRIDGTAAKSRSDHPHVGGDFNGVAGEKKEAGGDNRAEWIARQSAHGLVEFVVEVSPLLPGQIAPGAQQLAVAAGLMDGANAHARHHDEKERQEGGERVLAAEAQRREMAVIVVGW